MCAWGTDELVRVWIDPALSATGEGHWKWIGIDACIAPIVEALQAAGIHMLSSCCGHGRDDGRIDLADGRVLTVHAGRSEG